MKSAILTKHHLHRSRALILFDHSEVTLIPWIGFSLIPQGVISRLISVISTTVDNCCMKRHGMTLTARVYQEVLILPSCSCLSMAICIVRAVKKYISLTGTTLQSVNVDYQLLTCSLCNRHLTIRF